MIIIDLPPGRQTYLKKTSTKAYPAHPQKIDPPFQNYIVVENDDDHCNQPIPKKRNPTLSSLIWCVQLHTHTQKSEKKNKP